MTSVRRPAGFAGALVLLLALAVGAPRARSAPALSSPLAPYRAALLRADSLSRLGRPAGADSVLAGVLREARARSDTRAIAGLLVIRGRIWVFIGQPARVERDLDEALARARALDDSVLVEQAHRLLGIVTSSDGRWDASRAHCEASRALCVALRDTAGEGRALTGLAYADLMQGRLPRAKDAYERAVRLLANTSDARGGLQALVGLGRTRLGLADYDGAKACFEQVTERAHAIGDWWNEASAWNNLGAGEYQVGDPARAMEDYARSIALYPAGSAAAIRLIPETNMALALQQLGRVNEADRALRALTERCRREGAKLELAHVFVRRSAIAEERRLWREAVALADSASAIGAADPAVLSQAAIARANALASLNELGDALPALDAARAHPGVGPSSAIRLDYWRTRARIVRGQVREALTIALESRRQAGAFGAGDVAQKPYEALAHAWLAAGEPDSALAALSLAEAAWAAARDVPRDPEWRAARGVMGAGLRRLHVRTLLEYPTRESEARRTAAAFDALQRYKARSVLERVIVPGGAVETPSLEAMREPVTLAELQQSVLAPGELLVEMLSVADTCIVFLAARERCEAFLLPVRPGLSDRLRLYRDLLASASATRAERDPELLTGLGRSLAREALGPVVDRIGRYRRLVIAPDGLFHLVPFAALPAADGRPLVEHVEVVTVPSASVLAAVHDRAPWRHDRGALRILAVAGLRTATGTPLPGTAREAGRLERTYRGVELFHATAGHRLPAQALDGYDVLHLAAHATVDDQRPWRSSLWVGAGAAADTPLAAADIASSRYSARLAVLSSCSSAQGQIRNGEGVLGLTGAFLGAQVPCVLATLWPVDDATAARAMERFYRRLARGETAAAALRHMQLELRALPATRDPFHWAGFVLVGDGDVRVPLARRAPGRAAVAIAVVVGIVLALVTIGRLAGGSPRKPAADPVG